MANFIQNTPEWEEMRKEKIGSSDASAIMGVSPYDTPYGLWQKKLGIVPPTQRTPQMDRGHDLEPQARLQIGQELGVELKPLVKFHPTIPWMIASLDGLSDDNKTLVEIKCPGYADHLAALEGHIPQKYYPQLQHQLEVCGLEKGYYFSYDGKRGIKVEFYRDDKYIKKLILIEKEFYICLQDLIAPPLTDKDYQQIENPEWSDLASQWQKSHTQLKRLEEEEKILRERLISLCEHQSSSGNGIRVTRFLRKGSIDYSKIPQLKDLNLDKFRKEPMECWKVSAIK